MAELGIQAQRHFRAQTYAAELASPQAAAFDFCLAGATWFHNEANASQLGRFRRHIPVETGMSLAYAVSVARKAGVEFAYCGTMRSIGDVPAVMLHGALRHLAEGWTRYLKKLAENKKRKACGLPGLTASPPKFRSVSRGGSLYWQVQKNSAPRPIGEFISITREDTGSRPPLAVIHVPGIGSVVIRYHRELPADTTVRFATLRIDSLGKYWLTIHYDTAQVRQPASSGVVGVDVGVAVTVATSDGEVYNAPSLSPGQQQRMDRLRRAMDRKRNLNPCKHDRFTTIKGRSRLVRGHCLPPGHPGHDCDCWKHSKRYAQNRAEFTKLNQRATRQRTAASHLASRALADKYAIVAMENLNVSGMTGSAKGTLEEPGRNVRQKAGLNREIRDRAWSRLRRFTEYKTQVAGVPAPYTSQRCPRCGHIEPTNRPSRDVFRCASCGLTGHADVIAARNIRDRYMVPTAAAQAVAAREICLVEGQQPANSQPDSRAEPEPQEIVCYPTGNLIPEKWGKVGGRPRLPRRRSRRSRKRNQATASELDTRCDTPVLLFSSPYREA